MTDEQRAKAVVEERAHHAGDDTPAVAPRRRMSAGRKQDAVLRLLRGEDLELVSRELGVTAADLSGWRDSLLAAGTASLKSRPEGSSVKRSIRWIDSSAERGMESCGR